MAIEKWFEYDSDRAPDFLPGPFQSFLGEMMEGTSVAEDISSIINSATQGAGNVITSIGDAKAGGGLSRAVGDTALKIGVGVGVALAAYAILRKKGR